MWDFLKALFETDFMSHGHCYRWLPEVLWLHVISDALIALAYFSIPFALIYFIRKRSDLAFKQIFVLFVLFILLCGATHLMGIWSVWHGTYRLTGVIKAATALVSVGTAVVLWPLVPQALRLPSPKLLEEANAQLKHEIAQRKETEAELRRQTNLLERAEQLAHLGYWHLSLPTNVLTWSDEVYRIHGVAPESLELTLEQGIGAYHPDDRDFVANAVQQAITHGNDFEFEARIVRPDGDIRTITARGECSLNESGEVDALFGVIMDITARREATDALQESQKRFQSAFGFAPIGMALVGLQGQWLEVNRALCDILGYSADELLATDFQTITHPEDLEADLDFVQQMLAREIETYQMEKRYIHKNGGVIWALLSVSLVTNRQSEPLYFISQIQDITERKQSEEALRRAYRALNSSLSGIVLTDLDGTITFANPAFLHMFEYADVQEVLGKKAIDLLATQKVDSLEDILKLLNQTESETLEFPAQRRDNSHFPVELTASVIYNLANEMTGRMASFLDITERKQAEEGIRRYAKELERSNEELEQFAYVASHDLQEPLRKVKSFTELLAKHYAGQLDDRADKYIRYVIDGAERMHLLINDLLTYSRVGRRELHFKPVDLNTALELVLSDLELKIQENAAEITYDTLPHVEGHQPFLQQLFLNLISNALKFRGEAPPHIQITVKPNGADWLFSVKDNGIGIDPKFRERIFIIFQRLHGRSAYPGTGIGLAICKKIVERHGGRIWVAPDSAQGTTFSFTLPQTEKQKDNG